MTCAHFPVNDLDLTGRLDQLTAAEVAALSITASPGVLEAVAPVPGGIF